MANIRKRTFYLILLCSVIFVTHRAYAQFGATISGIVTDPSGAIVPGAALTLRNTATSEQRVATTSAAGVYQFPSLSPGSYELTTVMKGFSTSKIALTLETNQPLNVPVNLAVGTSTETVNVNSQGPLLDTADTRLQETLPTETLSALPLAGRNMISLVTLAPGATGTVSLPTTAPAPDAITIQLKRRSMPARMAKAPWATCTSWMVSTSAVPFALGF